MTNFIQEKLIKWILQPMHRVKKLIPDKGWSFLTSIAVLVMVLLHFAQEMGSISRYLLMIVPFCVCLGIIILAGLTENMKPIRFSKTWVVCWFGTGAFILLSGVLVDHDCLGDAMLWLVAFPVFFVVWGNNQLERLVKPVFNGVYASFVACILLCMYDYPVKQALYQSFFGNLNSLAMYASTVSVVAVIDVLSQKKLNLRMVVADVMLGISYSLSYYTGSRAGQAVTVISGVVALAMFLIVGEQKLWKKAVFYILPALLALAIFMPNTAGMINNGYFAIEKMDIKPRPEVVEPVAPVETPTVVVEDEWKSIQQLNEERRAQGVGKGFDAFSTGRLSLWKAYLKQVKFLGNSSSNEVYDEYGVLITKSAHCTLIQMAYEYGALAAVFFMIFNVVFGLKAVKYAWQNKTGYYSIFPLTIALAYGAYYLVEKIMYPATSLLLLLYLMSQFVLISKTEKMPETIEN